jgi:hypothetical protein
MVKKNLDAQLRRGFCMAGICLGFSSGPKHHPDLDVMVPIADNERVGVVVTSVVIPDHYKPASIPKAY